ncbi:MAG: 16S rRNA (guanine(527)-N(7))-methyltransferase RsmG [Brevinema sp.]
MMDKWIQEFLMWNKVHNLMAEEEATNITEHIEDSLALVPYLDAQENELIVDIGSGGGFPVIPLAIYAKEHGKNWRFIATDVVDKKIAFLKWSRSKFGLAVEVIKVDKRLSVDEPCTVTSRAFSDVVGILKWTKRHAPGCNLFLLLKGKKATEELTAAKLTQYEIFPAPRGCIARVENPLG